MRRSKLLVFLLLFTVFALSFSIVSYAASAQYTLTYHANNGTTDTVVDTSDTNSFTVLPQDTFDPADSGSSSYYYVFKEWNTSANGSGTSVSPGDTYYPTSSILTHAVTDFDLYAIWQTVRVRNYTVTYMPNYPADSSLTDPATYTVDGPYTAGTEVTARESSPYTIPTGYSLSGWSQTEDGWAEYYPGEVLTMPAEDLLLYAVWTTKPTLDRGNHFIRQVNSGLRKT